MSFDPNDWTQTPQNNPSSYGQQEAGYQLPTARPQGSDLPLEQIQLQNEEVAMNVTAGALQEGFEYVKKHPLETLLMSFLTLIFSSSSSCNVPTGNFGGSGSSSDEYDYSEATDVYDPGAVDYGSWFDGSDVLGMFNPESLFSAGSPLLGQADLFGLGLGEAALIGIVVFIIILALIAFGLSVLVKFGTTSLWLRILRGQDATLGASFGGAGRSFMPLALTLILNGLGMFAVILLFMMPVAIIKVIFPDLAWGLNLALVLGGFLMCSIPIIILSYGWYFVHFMVIDKNIAYVDALKASWRLTDGHKLELLVFSIIAVLLNVAGFLMCCVGMIATNGGGPRRYRGQLQPARRPRQRLLAAP